MSLDYFDAFRFGHLTAYLRQRAPLTNVNGSVLVYRLRQAVINQAVEGPALVLASP